MINSRKLVKYYKKSIIRCRVNLGWLPVLLAPVMREMRFQFINDEHIFINGSESASNTRPSVFFDVLLGSLLCRNFW